jgi:type II secretory pathway pseudopilin PulG
MSHRPTASASRGVTRRFHAAGFTIPEFLVVAVVMTVFVGGLLLPFASFLETRRVAATQRSLDLVRERILEFAARNGRLPCPADPAGTSGLEWVTPAGGCGGMPAPAGVASGVVPWTTLQTPEADAWGTRFTYSVQSEWADNVIDAGCIARERFSSFCGSSAASLAVFTRMQPTGPATHTGLELVAIVVSHGANARGGFANGGAPTAAPSGGDELQNRLTMTAGVVQPINSIVMRDPTPDVAACSDGSGPSFCLFDDRAAVIGKSAVLARVIAEGRLQ